MVSDPLWLRLRNHPSLFCLHMTPTQAAVLMEELAEVIERRGVDGLDLTAVETAAWLRGEAATARDVDLLHRSRCTPATP